MTAYREWGVWLHEFLTSSLHLNYELHVAATLLPGKYPPIFICVCLRGRRDDTFRRASELGFLCYPAYSLSQYRLSYHGFQFVIYHMLMGEDAAYSW
jgi:hypothetical protein